MSSTPSTEDHHLIRFKTVLGKDALIATDFSSKELMSQGFRFEIIAFSETQHSLQPKDLVGTKATIGLVKDDGTIRYFNGFIKDLVGLGSTRAGQRTEYKLTLTSWLELLLDKRSDCRVFQEKTVKDLLPEIFAPYGGAANYKLDLTLPHPERRFVIQYNETDLEFFNRICLREGIAYYFKHEDGSHQLHLIDKSDSLSVLSPKTVKLQIGTFAYDHFSYWERAGNFVTGTYKQRSYNYMTPSKELTGT
ncbi:hypothetical protein MNBD_GAMMA03-1720, partial [hydrothermal vent metagenome]